MSFPLWGHTLMGIPQIATLPQYYVMSSRFFLISLIVQILFFFLFSYIIVFSFYRAIRKVTNPYVYQSIQIQEQIIDKDKQNTPGQNIKQTQEARIKKKKNGALVEQKAETKNFEDQQQLSENKQAQKQDKQSQSSQQESDEDGSESEKSEQQKQIRNQSEQQIATKIKLFNYQQSLLKLAPWCFVFLFNLNHFTIDYISLIAIFFTVISYFVFNMFNVAEKHPMLKNLFLIGVFAGFIPFFINKQDFTT